jgi:RNA polymerase sigma factor (sigma-70 family)
VKTARARMIFDCLRRAVLPPGAGLTDGQLLRQYFAYQDEDAFAALVRRHGPMVLGVCRRLLRRAEDAEDAFQAAFVVLARKGLRIAERQTIGGWLHGVAYRVALDVRRRGARRRSKEHQVEDMPHPLAMPEEDQSELLAKLDRELARLPEKYRVPVVLCELEGRSRKEAARQLGLPEGTLSSRLATARKTLAKRMAGHGPAVAGASLTALFASQAGAVVVPGPLVASTVRAAGGVVSAGVVALAEGVLKAMLLTKIKGAALVLLLTSAIGVGAVGLTYRTAAAADDPPANAPRATAKAANPDKDDLEALRLEVEALRVSLQATRERVKGLEAEVHALKAAEQRQGVIERREYLETFDRRRVKAAEATPPATPPATTTPPIPTQPAAEPPDSRLFRTPETSTPPIPIQPAAEPVQPTPQKTVPGRGATTSVTPPAVKDDAPSVAGPATGEIRPDGTTRSWEKLSATDKPSGTTVELIGDDLLATGTRGKLLWKWNNIVEKIGGEVYSLTIKDNEVHIRNGKDVLKVTLLTGRIISAGEEKAEKANDPSGVK